MPTTARTRRPSLSDAQWRDLAERVIIPALREGTPIGVLYERYGGQNHIRQALASLGVDTRGRKIKLEISAGSTPRPSRLADRVARRRRERAPWWLLELETGTPASELRALLVRYGHQDVAEGRVIQIKV